ncbi:hypothetical protein B0A50_05159 [Salinomyces thailandicus]|uniref:Tetratricopeptide SHNi-TPR domain-containing protein n=1 Tax=Salinomyces thailandicus TaxID=706561 RepID=A0A4U0TX47_9PEZI|nr:hypothetical protein B0A50_05159 [Salinomyces thailandica]
MSKDTSTSTSYSSFTSRAKDQLMTMDSITEDSAEVRMKPEELPTKLDQLKASATREYSLKNYAAAVELYSEAAEVQDEMNGEMVPENADLLYQYGRCLYHVAVAKSDVLGGKVASSEEPKKKKRKVAPAESGAAGASKGNTAGLLGDAMKTGEQKTAEEVVEAAVDEKDGVEKDESAEGNKPFFQITGDENWTDSEDDEDEAGAEAEEDEDDFAIAYEILDVARVLLGRKLESVQQAAGKETTEQSEVRHLKERLADTHDLQAEISLENERFADAINDTRDSLALKLELYTQENSLIAEAHFKLSLALEFASVTSTADGEGESSDTKVAQVDEKMRAEAAAEMEKAIASCRLRISKEEESLASLEAAKAEERRKTIQDVKEMVADMEQRLIDLQNPAVSLSGAAATGPAGAPDGSDPLRGVLGAMLGESKIEQQRRLQEATSQANDLSGLVKQKKKAKPAEDMANGAGEGKGKRKAGEDDDGKGLPLGKKPKSENGA